jgi:hypothetical protein
MYDSDRGHYPLAAVAIVASAPVFAVLAAGAAATGTLLAANNLVRAAARRASSGSSERLRGPWRVRTPAHARRGEDADIARWEGEGGSSRQLEARLART